MKKLTFLFLTAACFSLSLVGCGGDGGNTVVEAPPIEEESTAIEGMTDEEYDKAMEADMQ